MLKDLTRLAGAASPSTLCLGLAAAAAIRALHRTWGVPWGKGPSGTPAPSPTGSPHATAVITLSPFQAKGQEGLEAPPSAREQWVPVAAPAPAAPPASPDFKPAVEVALPLTVFDFWRLFLSCESHLLMDHYAASTKNLVWSGWQSGDEGELQRTLTFVQPRQGVQPVDVPCSQRQALTVHSDGCLVLRTLQKQHDSPYCDCYTVQTWWKVEPDNSRAGCIVRIHVAVPFTRSPLVRPIIAKSGFHGARTFFASFLDKIKACVETEVLAASVSRALQAGPGGDADPQLLRRLADAAHLLERRLTSDQRHHGAVPAGALGERRATGRLPAGSGAAAAAPAAAPQRALVSGRAWASSSTPAAWSSRADLVLLLIVLLLQALVIYDNMSTRQQMVAAMGACLAMD